MDEKETAEIKEETSEKKAGGRDFGEEVSELAKERPELFESGAKLPEEVTRACAAGKRLKDAYAEYDAAHLGSAKAEDAHERAPVSGVTGGGSVTGQETDDFLRGLNEDY